MARIRACGKVFRDARGRKAGGLALEGLFKHLIFN